MNLEDFKAGDVVALHPATGWWMRGAKFGTVERVGRTVLFVRLHLMGKPMKMIIRLASRNVTEIVEA